MNTIKEWKNEVKEYLESINKELQISEQSKELYYGFEVIDGELKMNPEILFMGINPGAGSGERTYEIKLETDRISYLDDFDGNYRYQLARETIQLFKQVGLSEDEIISKLEKDCVKTNFYHISTVDGKDIKKCFDKSELKFGAYWNKCLEFNLKIISILKPKIVIFEGKSVYDDIISDTYGIKNSWDSHANYGYYYSENENIHFIGYKRLLSNITSNKDLLASKIKAVLKNP